MSYGTVGPPTGHEHIEISRDSRPASKYKVGILVPNSFLPVKEGHRTLPCLLPLALYPLVLLLLDERFMDAYKNGILVECGDGVVRRLFPRILTYSADYPEKYASLHRSGLIWIVLIVDVG